MTQSCNLAKCGRFATHFSDDGIALCDGHYYYFRREPGKMWALILNRSPLNNKETRTHRRHAIPRKGAK